MNDTLIKQHSEEEWKQMLTPGQYQALRKSNNERPYTGKFYQHHQKGIYSCAACGNMLFTSEMKFDSPDGRASFFDELKGQRIKTQSDTSFGYLRTEILCGNCNSHIGHLFVDTTTLTGKRYSVNSVCLDFHKSGIRKTAHSKKYASATN
jgi:methionine-R-sulfoxide reductase